MYCSNCGSIANDNFCSNCGVKNSLNSSNTIDYFEGSAIKPKNWVQKHKVIRDVDRNRCTCGCDCYGENPWGNAMKCDD